MKAIGFIACVAIVVAVGAAATAGLNWILPAESKPTPVVKADWRMSDQQIANEAKRVISTYFDSTGVPRGSQWWITSRVIRRDRTHVDVYASIQSNGPRRPYTRWRIPMQRVDYVTLPPVPLTDSSGAR